MGWLVMAVGLTILIITGSYQNQKMSETTNAQQSDTYQASRTE